MNFGTILIVLAVASAPLCVRAAAPAVTVDVDASALPRGDVTDDLVRHIIEHQAQVLAEGGLEVRDDAPLTMRVTVSRYGDGDVNYRASITVLEAGSDTPTAERTLTCELCRDGELVVRIGEEVARMSGFILYTPEERPDDGAAHPTPAEPEDDPVDAEPQEQGDDGAPATAPPPPAVIGPMGYVGIGSLVTGAGSLAAGIALSLLPDQTRSAGVLVERRSTRTAGIVVASVGSVLVASGVALLVVDVVRRKRQRRVSWMPAIAAGQVMVTMGVRF